MVAMKWTELGGQEVEVSFFKRDDRFILFKMQYDGALIMERLYDLDAADRLADSWGEICADWEGEFITPSEVQGSADELLYIIDASWTPANWQGQASAPSPPAPTLIV
jgi:hypothetical protein